MKTVCYLFKILKVIFSFWIKVLVIFFIIQLIIQFGMEELQKTKKQEKKWGNAVTISEIKVTTAQCLFCLTRNITMI